MEKITFNKKAYLNIAEPKIGQLTKWFNTNCTEFLILNLKISNITFYASSYNVDLKLSYPNCNGLQIVNINCEENYIKINDLKEEYKKCFIANINKILDILYNE